MKTIDDTDDFQLLRSFVETNSQDAFTQLVNEHIDLVYSICLRETNDPVLAQDVTQAVFLILFRKAASIKKGTVLAGWLFNTSRFAARNARRQEARRKNKEQEFLEAMSHSTGHIEVWQAIEPLLHDAIASLGAKDREAILLRYFEDKNLKEVGFKLNITENAAQMRVSRAVEKLKQHLRKSGVTVPVALLSTLLSGHAVQVAPVSCAQTVGHLLFGMTTGSATAVSTGLTATKAYSISQGVAKSMLITKLKITLTPIIAALSVTGVVGTAYISNLFPVGSTEAHARINVSGQTASPATIAEGQITGSWRVIRIKGEKGTIQTPGTAIWKFNSDGSSSIAGQQGKWNWENDTLVVTTPRLTYRVTPEMQNNGKELILHFPQDFAGGQIQSHTLERIESAVAPRTSPSNKSASPGQQLQRAGNNLPSNDNERFYTLTKSALLAATAGQHEKAQTYARDLLELAPSFKSNWNYGNAIHKGHLTLGHVALSQGDLETAKKELIAAGKTPGSPQLNSFGPNMTLAKALLDKGEKAAVLQYLDECKSFWSPKFSQLDKWKNDIQSGRSPNFGPNLRY